MSEPKDKRVYCHVSNIDNKIFYVGSGSYYRPTRKAQRTKGWDFIAKKGYRVRVLKDFLNKSDSLELEELIIDTIGIDNLVNIGTGHHLKGKPSWNKGKTNYLSEEAKKKMGMSMARQCIDVTTNKKYKTLTDACKDINVSYSTTHKKLNGHLLNTNNNIKYI